MKVVKGIYNEAKIFTDIVDEACVEQIKGLLDLEVFREAKVRIMPDCHAGASCVIGFTADLGDKVIPNIVGVDIGCGMLTLELGDVEIDFEKLDEIIRKKVPYGRNVNEGRLMRFTKLQSTSILRVPLLNTSTPEIMLVFLRNQHTLSCRDLKTFLLLMHPSLPIMR